MEISSEEVHNIEVNSNNLNIEYVAQFNTREQWRKDVEFLFSCIALSVGLGNVWRFPFIALENGGAAFVIPYIIMTILVGRPLYYMEVLLGQFSSCGHIQVYNFAPIMKGIAYGQVYATCLAITYYAAIMAITLKYLSISFAEIMPWTICLREWGEICHASNDLSPTNKTVGKRISSTELFYTKTVLKENTSIKDGIGLPNWDLVICLFIVWIVIFVVLIKGVRSSGRTSYFFALFPYLVMFILFLRALTLPGAMNGIAFFLKPKWHQLLNAEVWYNALSQMFFSLAICFGTLSSYASFNNFHRSVNRDVAIITSVDSLTSLLAGCIIFGMLGNLAYETNTENISEVVREGAGLAFISYPEAIAKFTIFPQFFAVLFFLMLFVLGVGSNVGMVSCVITVIRNRFRTLPNWYVASGVSVIGFLCGIVYTTPGGQSILNLIDFYGCSFIAIFLAIPQVISVSWIYGVKQLCADIKFMLNIETGIYWRLCWAIFSPGIMIFVLFYTLANFKEINYNGEKYPDEFYALGWCIWAIGVGQFPCWLFYTIYKQIDSSFWLKLKNGLKPNELWGPMDPSKRVSYKQQRRAVLLKEKQQNLGFWLSIYDNILG